MEIKEIDKDLAVYFVRQYHYSKIIPKITKYYLGYYDDNELLGVMTLGYGTQPLGTIKKIFYKHNLKSTDYLEIGKMCFLPKCNNDKSFGTKVLSLTIKWLKKNTDRLFLYTMADGIMGKCGYVYQASSMTYLGSFETSVYLDELTGEKIHPRSARKLLEENAKELGKDHICWLTQDFCEKHNISRINGLMFRYITALNKAAKKILNEYDEYKHIPYPKDKDLKWKKRIDNNIYVYICKPNFNMSILNYNTQRCKPLYEQLQLDFNERNDKNG